MPRVTYVYSDGARQTFDVSEGVSVMQAAVANGVNGIVGECGGNGMCATCHVYIEPGYLDATGEMLPDEDALLDGVAGERRSNSRLSCQLLITTSLDGLVVELPKRQL